MELSLPNFYQGKNKIKIQLSKQPSYIYCYSTLNMEKKRDKKMSNKQPTYLYIYIPILQQQKLITTTIPTWYLCIDESVIIINI